MSRLFSNYVSTTGKQLLEILVNQETSVENYRSALQQLGKELGVVLASKIALNQEICLACTVEDADYLAKGVLEGLNRQIALACFWNQRQQTLSIAPIIYKYREPNVAQAKIIIIVKSIISGACVVKTNLTNLIQEVEPEKIFVVAPVIHIQAPEKLEKEFPQAIVSKFNYIYFAEDSEKQADGILIPGIGGDVYQRLGFENQIEKNKYIPLLIKQRRTHLLQQMK